MKVLYFAWVRERVGKTDEEILSYMTDRYGDYVLYKPPLAPRTWLLWAAPVILLLIGAVAFSLYAVETVFHLMAFVDSDALAHGEAAPIAMTHVGLGALLYPISGWALVLLAASMGRAAGGWRWVPAVVGVVAGLLHALSVPMVILFPDVELTPMFAGAAMLIALWTLVLGLSGAPRTAVRRTPAEPALV